MASFNDCFLKACRKEETEYTPVWFMRQAGRALPEYRRIRERYTLLDICYHPEIAAQVTLLPVETLGVDAAILFADLTLPFISMGVSFELLEGRGPTLSQPLRSETDLDHLTLGEPEEDLPFVYTTIRLLRERLTVPLIGFVGGPFTLAAYLIEGGASRDFPQTRVVMYKEERFWHHLMDLLTQNLIRYAVAQVEAGVHAVQVFDSWVGVVGPETYRKKVFPYNHQLIQALSQTGVPVIHFGTGTTNLLPLMAQSGEAVVGVDWRIPLDVAWEKLEYRTGIQGNLDPAVLLADFSVVAEEARQILQKARRRPGHIFNLGHGVLPETPVDHLKQLVELVHQETHR